MCETRTGAVEHDSPAALIETVSPEVGASRANLHDTGYKERNDGNSAGGGE